MSKIQIILGTMNIDYPFKSNKGNLSLEEEEEENKKIVHTYLSSSFQKEKEEKEEKKEKKENIPILDTAYYYGKGKTHTSLSNILADFDEKESIDSYFVATKINPWYDNDFVHGKMGGLSRQNIEIQVETSLKDLHREKVDIMFLHAYDYETPLEETLETMQQLWEKGKWTEWGLSNFSLSQCEDVLRICQENNYHPPSVYQGMYNILCRKVEELFPFLEKHDMRFWAYNPLCGGLLLGKTQKIGRFSNPIYQNIFWKEEIVKISQQLHQWALKKGMETGGLELALLWLRDHSQLRPGKDAIILGASSLSQFQQNWDILLSPPSSSSLTITDNKEVEKKVSILHPEVIPSYWY
jgi:aflatoxin B1 aldehyde reductase